MKILHITDSHGSVKAPESRKDVYYYSFLKKLYELKHVIQNYGIDLVIHTGDMFHTPRVSDKFAGQVSEMLNSWNVPIYVVPGNHDIDGYSISTLDQTKLGLLSKAGVINILDRNHPFKVNTNNLNGDTISIGISGQEYYHNIDSGNQDDFKVDTKCDINILAIHGYLCTTPQHPNIKCTQCKDVVTDADIILAGHYHQSFSYEDNDFSVYNPGSMMRVEQNEYNKTHIPQYGILEINYDEQGNIDYEYTMHHFRIAEPSNVVFDYNSKYVSRSHYINLDSFKQKLEKVTMKSNKTIDMITIIKNIVKDNYDIFNNNDEAIEVSSVAFKYYNDALKNSTDVFGAPQGYIEGNPVYITSVDIKNFQSHSDTHIDFDKGMNIFTGESNNGKTSVLRAIIWCLFNTPNGNAFITAGKKDCMVKVTFSNGTYIERGRTLKDAGYYDICKEDGTITTYKGMASNMPIDIINIHQMPEVQITKTLSSHLNVMSQLDTPFLISDSPVEKAAAIGRITGVQNLDVAIKSLKADIRQDKISLKKLEENKTKINDNINALPDVNAIKNVEEYLRSIVEYCKKLDKNITDINYYKQSIDKVNKDIIIVKKSIDRCKKIKIMSPYITGVYHKYSYVKKLSEYKGNISSIESLINNMNNAVNNLKEIVLLNTIASGSMSVANQVNKLNDKRNMIYKIDNNINKIHRDKYVINETFNLLRSISTYVFMEFSIYKKLSEKKASLNIIDSNINANKNVLQATKNNKDMYVKDFENLQKEYLSSVTECPCCGQKLSTKKAAKHMFIYLTKENNHGK